MTINKLSKPLTAYEDWKGAFVTLNLINKEVLEQVVVVELMMTAGGFPHTLSCRRNSMAAFVMNEHQEIVNVPFSNIMYYTIHSWPIPSAPVVDTRNTECVKVWPECQNGSYNPKCCRFPKSCSC